LTLKGYYFHDSRVINGLESTFASEAVVGLSTKEPCTLGTISAVGEFFLNQPISKNVSQNQRRTIYTTVYDPDPFEVSLLYIGLGRDSVAMKFGKAESPFGRYYFPIYSNSHFDAPFIRTEAILWKETGIMFRYHPNTFSFDLAVSNGETERDTNSSKAVLARLGFDSEGWALGVSGKKQDGRGSEQHKVYNNHLGVDAMYRVGKTKVSLEAIYDEYGCVNANCVSKTPERISLYYRDLYYKEDTPITGIGGYLDIFYDGKIWDLDINYGEFYPKKINNPYHDDPIKRGLLKGAYSLSACTKVFFVGLLENDRTTDKKVRGDHENWVMMFGLSYTH